MKIQSSIFIIFSAFFFGTYGIWSKLMSSTFSEFNQAWIRGLVVLILVIPFGYISKSFRKIEKSDVIWFVVIAIFYGLNQAPYFYGFKHLSVGTGTLLFYTALVFGTFIIGRLFFNEKITKIKYIALIIAIIGLGIIYRLTLTQSQIFPAICTMVAGLMGASGVVFSKKLSSKYSEAQILSIFFSFMAVSNFIISFFLHEHVPVLNPSWFALLGYSGAYVLANTFVVLGMKHLEPSVGGLLGLLEVIFAAIFGILIFHEHITLQFLIGSILIIFSAGLPDLYALTQKYS